jgi:hypothetical protein
MKKLFLNSIGWIGLVLILSNQAFVALGFMQSWYSPELFLITNVLGSIAIAYVSYKKKAFEPMTLNLILVLITLFGYIFQKANF